MTKKQIDGWLERGWPVTIVADRYNGSYSGGAFLAFPLEHRDLPGEADNEDIICLHFWSTYKGPVGTGGSPDEALGHLRSAMRVAAEAHTPAFYKESFAEVMIKNRRAILEYNENLKRHIADFVSLLGGAADFSRVRKDCPTTPWKLLPKFPLSETQILSFETGEDGQALFEGQPLDTFDTPDLESILDMLVWAYEGLKDGTLEIRDEEGMIDHLEKTENM